MIQILKLRTWIPKEGKNAGKEVKYDKFVDPNLHAKSVQDLFKNIDTYVGKIHKKESWNLFYTIANCTENKREFSSQRVIAFDLDGINTDKVEAYITTVCETLGIERAKTGIVFSGHGLHFLIGTKKAITDKGYFKKNRHHYKALTDSINAALKAKDLPGKTDTTCFDARRILRLPKTINRKAGREPVQCNLINGNIDYIEFDIKEKSGLPDIKENAQLSKEFMRKYPRTDKASVMSGCEFLKWAVENPDDVNEPQWYAALSVTARLEEGHALSHEISRGHSNYSAEETELKIEQALESSGPRTCTNINNIWGQCAECPHYQKVNSPILIRGEDAIPTEFTGFHNVFISTNGQETYKPNYDDLLKFFERNTQFKNLGDSRMCHVWTGTHYVPIGNATVESFAQEHFKPSAKTSHRREFRERVSVENIRQPEWFAETTHKKMNFKNGVLDIETLEFSEHCPDKGFRYVLPYDYDPNADCPIFKTMMETVTEGNESLFNVLTEYMGYALSNDRYWAHKALVLIGKGANGKSTFMDTIKSLAGSGNYASLNVKDLDKSEYSRQMLDGKLFNISEETPTKSMHDSSLFKALSSGGEVQVRAPYKDPYFIKNRAKMIFSCNELPDTSDATYGMLRRFLIVPFNAKFTEDTEGFDPYIQQKLDAELSGIFNLALAGHQRLEYQGHFTKSEVITKEVDKYHLDIDNVANWSKEHAVILTNGATNDYFMPYEDLYFAYKTDMLFENEFPLTKHKFLKRMRSIYPELDNRETVKRIENKPKKGFLGIRLERDEPIKTEDRAGVHVY